MVRHAVGAGDATGGAAAADGPIAETNLLDPDNHDHAASRHPGTTGYVFNGAAPGLKSGATRPAFSVINYSVTGNPH